MAVSSDIWRKRVALLADILSSSPGHPSEWCKQGLWPSQHWGPCTRNNLVMRKACPEVGNCYDFGQLLESNDSLWAEASSLRRDRQLSFAPVPYVSSLQEARGINTHTHAHHTHTYTQHKKHTVKVTIKRKTPTDLVNDDVSSEDSTNISHLPSLSDKKFREEMWRI